MKIINWLQVFCRHLCQWLLLPLITASFFTCLSISSTWWCRNNIPRLCWLWNARAAMKAQSRSPHKRNAACQAWCCHGDAWCSLAFWCFWNRIGKVHNTEHWSYAAQRDCKKSETGTTLRFFAYLLSRLQVNKAERRAGCMEIPEY